MFLEQPMHGLKLTWKTPLWWQPVQICRDLPLQTLRSWWPWHMRPGQSHTVMQRQHSGKTTSHFWCSWLPHRQSSTPGGSVDPSYSTETSLTTQGARVGYWRRIHAPSVNVMATYYNTSCLHRHYNMQLRNWVSWPCGWCGCKQSGLLCMESYFCTRSDGTSCVNSEYQPYLILLYKYMYVYCLYPLNVLIRRSAATL